MIPDISDMLAWLERHPQALKGIKRGIERETLRVNEQGQLAGSGHPEAFGSALMHPWITTDFAEAMLEFITPVDESAEHLLTVLQDIHSYVARHLGNERMWPFSMPCHIAREEDIQLAQYGSSNLGRFKTLYREGLKNRYGALMQTISGIHYNFSFPMAFWQAKEGITDETDGKEIISAGYFRLIRNYYRFGWVIPYLFGASPAICSTFMNGRAVKTPFEQLSKDVYYLPYATSLRMSDLGYTNKSQGKLGITFNSLQSYVGGLRRAIQTPSEEFSQLGIRVDGHYRQINGNILQTEQEFYAPIRPKRVAKADESYVDVLQNRGIEYVEVRALDINPFSPIGVSASQVYFLDLFLIWCALADAPEMNSEELLCCRQNWDRVILEGRKPNQIIGFGCGETKVPLSEVGKGLFDDLSRIARVLDQFEEIPRYLPVCDELNRAFADPELTLSAQVLQLIRQQPMQELGLSLAERYHQQLIATDAQVFSDDIFTAAAKNARQGQHELESADSLSFEAYLVQKAKR